MGQGMDEDCFCPTCLGQDPVCPSCFNDHEDMEMMDWHEYRKYVRHHTLEEPKYVITFCILWGLLWDILSVTIVI